MESILEIEKMKFGITRLQNLENTTTAVYALDLQSYEADYG